MTPAKKKIIFYIVLIALFTAISLFIYRYREKIGKIAAPFFMAIIIAYLLSPLVKKLEMRNIKRSTSILLIYLGMTVALVTGLIFIVPEFIRNTRELINTLPNIVQQYQGMLNSFITFIESSRWPVEVKSTIYAELQNGSDIGQAWAMQYLKRSLASLLGIARTLLDILLAMFIAYYLIKDAEKIRESFLSIVPRRWRNGLVNTGREISGILANFIQGQLLTALIISIMETIGLIIVGTKYPLVMGLFGGITNVIPYFGPFIGAIPAVAVALLQSPMKAVWTVIVFCIVQQIDNNLISPKVIEGRLGLHPIATILAVLIGGEFFGIMGMLISVPIMAILRVILRRSIEAIV